MQKSPKLIMKGLPGAVRAGGDFQFQLQFAESLKSDHDRQSPAWQESMLWSDGSTDYDQYFLLP